MAKLKIVAAFGVLLAALVGLTLAFSRPSVPFRFLEGAELEMVTLLGGYRITSDSRTDGLIVCYRLKGTAAEVVAKATGELKSKGWTPVVSSLFAAHWRSPGEQDSLVFGVSTAGCSSVTIQSDASLIDRLRAKLGLLHRWPDPE